ncbi:MAG: NAD(P)-binding protein [Cyanobium sp. Prado107]|jgi:predicted NAD/FAD-dependent oxidoreductase|nr:NAD(P)-binding protein [Cyanobium sp. Prado107]
MPRPAPETIAVIGAGVSGCALAAQLRRLGHRGPLSLWETGRGAGGRASTRRSREDPQLAVDHGAPLLNITAEPAPALLEPLLAGGWIEPWNEPVAMLEGESRLNIGRPDALGIGRLYRGRSGMDQLSQGLLHLAGDTGVRGHFGVLVRHLELTPAGRWRLLDAAGQLLEEADWLVLSGTLLAHPRSRLIFDWPEVPLERATRHLQDLQLAHALTTIAGIRFEARSNLLLVFAGEAAVPWRALPFRLVNFDAAAQQRWGLRRISIQPLEDGRCAVVAHSSHAFAADHLDVYGAGSAVARQLQLPVEEGREEEVITSLGDALVQCLAPWIGTMDPQEAEPRLMRWAAAFPLPPGLPPSLTLCPASRVGFCGDYIDGVGFARIEGALHSAEHLAAALLAAAPSGAPCRPAGS